MATDIDTYPMETLSSMVVVKRRDNEADYQHDSKSNRDEAELAHFGKRQQLKVCNWTLLLTAPYADVYLLSPEDFRPCLHDRTDLHLDGYLGRNINVSCSLYLLFQTEPLKSG